MTMSTAETLISMHAICLFLFFNVLQIIGMPKTEMLTFTLLNRSPLFTALHERRQLVALWVVPA